MHSVVITQIDQSQVIRTMISRRQCNPIQHTVNAAGGADRKNVRGVDEPQLNPSDSATCAVGEHHLLPKRSQTEEPTDLLYDTSPLRCEAPDIGCLNRLQGRRPRQELEDRAFFSEPMKA